MTAIERPGMIRFGALALLAALLIGGGFMAGCGREQEPPVPTAPDLPTPRGAEPPDVDIPSAAAIKQLPVTIVLGYAPESAVWASAFTSVNDVYDSLAKLAAHVSPPGTDVAALLDEAFADVRAKRGAHEARSLSEFLRGEGVNPDEPVGFFVGSESLLATLEQMTEVTEAHVEELEQIYEERREVREVPVDFDIDMPGWAVVVHIADQEAFERMLLEEAAANNDAAPEEVAVAGRSIVSYGERDALNYFFFDDKACVGSSLDFVKQVAERAAAPAHVSYGTDAMPASPDDAMVALVRLDYMLDLMESAMELGSVFDSDGIGAYPAQQAMLRNMRDAYSDDPMVITVAYRDHDLKILSRTSYETHPGLRAITGDAAPLRLARAFSPDTGSLVSLRLTPEAKQQIQETWLESLPQDLQQSPEMFQVGMIVRQILQVIGDEIAIGVTGGAAPPVNAEAGVSLASLGVDAMLMVDLAEPQMLQGLLVLLPSLPDEPHDGVAIQKVAVPVPVDILYAIFDSNLVAATSRGELTAAIDALRSGEDRGLLAAVDPPLDSDADRFSLIVLRGRMYDQLLAQFLESSENTSPVFPMGVLQRIESLVGTQEVLNDVLHGGVTVRFRPLEAAVE